MNLWPWVMIMMLVCGNVWADYCTITASKDGKNVFNDGQSETMSWGGCDKYEALLNLARSGWKSEKTLTK